MKNIHLKFHRVYFYTILCVCVLAFAVQYVQTTIKTAFAESKSIRVTEVNTCSVMTEEEQIPHFSGCSSII